MTRVPPDANDGYVWLLSETSGAYRNSGNILPNDPSTDLSISGTVIRTNTGVFGGNCPWFPGIGGYPSGASATRNYIFGAQNINPQPPFTISLWVYLRQYNGGNFTHGIGKTFRDHTVTSSWTAPFFSVDLSIANTNGGQDITQSMATSATTNNAKTFTEFPLPLHQWSHWGLTHDGANMRAYLNGCQLMTYSGSTQSLTLVSGNVAYQDTTYGFTSSTGTYVSGVDDIGNHGDEVMTTVALPFPVKIYSVPYSSCSVSSNGFVEFGQATQGFNFSLPNSGFGALICAFQRDENTTSPFGIFTTTIGTAPNRTFIIEWRNQPFGGGSTLNYEIKFFEGNDTFETLYASSTSVSLGCIGVQSVAGGKSTVFSNSTVIPAANTRLIWTPTYSNPGYWMMGAVPATGSATKEEANYSVQDLRIANIARPLSYFKNIYSLGVTPLTLSLLTRYFKLRAYDTSCLTPTAVTWIDTQISLANAPAFPCSGPYSVPEVIDTWLA